MTNLDNNKNTVIQDQNPSTDPDSYLNEDDIASFDLSDLEQLDL